MKSRTESKYRKFINEEIELKSKMSNLRERMKHEIRKDITDFLKTKGYVPCGPWLGTFGETHVDSYHPDKITLIDYRYIYCDHVHFMVHNKVGMDELNRPIYEGVGKIVKWYFLRKTLEEVYMKMI